MVMFSVPLNMDHIGWEFRLSVKSVVSQFFL